METYAGLRVVESVHAVRMSGLNFPHSRNRSKRQLKKLLKRFGSQTRYSPAAFIVRDTIVIHPELLNRLKARQQPVSPAGQQLKACWFEEAETVTEHLQGFAEVVDAFAATRKAGSYGEFWFPGREAMRVKLSDS